ncbi:RNA polymerase subunit sigma-24 [Acidovorax sp. Root275]|uniref:RNA polymerase sigma factor n=1 Tax=Acidovorax sp. Root275 TaxID=1736508 RepID=UPI00070DDF50|nr:sigma-70 family RNA polymerase sigma factor [Acidovorax sp. Root275]KRD48368.1 RNA polymerase subunit sigma-24 [Acidovorax sp. Root275]
MATATDVPSTNLQALIHAAAGGDHAAFAQVYQRTHVHLFGVAVRMLGQGQAAEDVLQEAYVSIWKNAGSYRSEVGGQPIQPMTWLIAIVRNKALDALRARARRPESAWHDTAEFANGEGDGSETTVAASASALAPAPSALHLLEQATQALRIEGCMNALEGNYRQSLALAYYQGLSHSEVAAQMGAPLGSVKAWIRRGLERLKNCLATQGVGT